MIPGNQEVPICRNVLLDSSRLILSSPLWHVAIPFVQTQQLALALPRIDQQRGTRHASRRVSCCELLRRQLRAEALPWNSRAQLSGRELSTTDRMTQAETERKRQTASQTETVRSHNSRMCTRRACAKRTCRRCFWRGCLKTESTHAFTRSTRSYRATCGGILGSSSPARQTSRPSSVRCWCVYVCVRAGHFTQAST